MSTEAAGMRRVTRFSFSLTAQQNLVEADIIVVGSGAALTPQQLEQLLQMADPDGYEVRTLPGDAVFGAVAVKRSVLAATWMEDVLEAVRAVLEPQMDPSVVWCGSLIVRLEGEAIVDSFPPSPE